jgi:hypothetical protein
MSRLLRIVVAALIATVVASTLAAPSQAAFPGRNGKVVFWTFGSCCDLIWSMHPDGSDLRVIYSNPSQYARNPEVSPDGTKIAVETVAPRAGVGVVIDFGGHELFSWGGCASLCSSGSPVWSPDSIHLAWAVRAGFSDGVWVGSATGDVLIFPSPTIDVDSVRWSPDGTKLSFIDNGSILVINADGSGLHAAATQFPPDPGRTPISPDGTKRLYTDLVPATAPSRQIFSSNLDGTDATQLTNQTQDCELYPDTAACALYGPWPPFLPANLIWQSLAPLTCKLTASATNSSGQKYIQITVQDASLGLQAIAVTHASNAITSVPAFPVGTNDPVVVTATKVNQMLSSSVALEVTDLYGNVATCDPVLTTTIRSSGAPETQRYVGLAQNESMVEITNGNPGVKNLDLVVNGKTFNVTGLGDGRSTTLDVSSAMLAGSDNTLSVTARGKPGAAATIVIAEG